MVTQLKYTEIIENQNEINYYIILTCKYIMTFN